MFCKSNLPDWYDYPEDWQWIIVNRDDSTLSLKAEGQIATITNLALGTYDVTLTVQDYYSDPSGSESDTMILKVVEKMPLSLSHLLITSWFRIVHSRPRLDSVYYVSPILRWLFFLHKYYLCLNLCENEQQPRIHLLLLHTEFQKLRDTT